MSAITNLIIRLQRWMDSVPGQTFLNYAYSWGASIVILGALFKLTHLPGGNLMLFIGMGTEVVVFFISAFDRPFDKQEIGKVLPKTLKEMREQATVDANSETVDEEPVADEQVADDEPVVVVQKPAQVSAAMQTPTYPHVEVAAPAVEVTPQPAADTSQVTEVVQQLEDAVAQADTTEAPAATTPELLDATTAYVEKLRTLTETLQKVEEQSKLLASDSKEIGELNRTLTAISKAYELQLRTVSGQLGTIDEINVQTEQLAKQLASLNSIYSRMIAALNVQMPNPVPNPLSQQ